MTMQWTKSPARAEGKVVGYADTIGTATFAEVVEHLGEAEVARLATMQFNTLAINKVRSSATGETRKADSALLRLYGLQADLHARGKRDEANTLADEIRDARGLGAEAILALAKDNRV